MSGDDRIRKGVPSAAQIRKGLPSAVRIRKRRRRSSPSITESESYETLPGGVGQERGGQGDGSYGSIMAALLVVILAALAVCFIYLADAATKAAMP